MMKPISVEFSVQTGENVSKEEGVGLHSPAELLEFVPPGGGCEQIPGKLADIQMNFLPPAHPNT